MYGVGTKVGHRRLRPMVATLFVLFVLSGCRRGLREEAPVLRLAVTTSTRDSGLLDVLLPPFEQAHAARVDVIAVGTGAALRLGEQGEVDGVLVHARAAEDAFMADGYGVRREDVMVNTFLILGPAADPAKIAEKTPEEALRAVFAGGHRFVSRGDQSGTHKRELALWEQVGGRPRWENYMESGQGMGASLTMANELAAYILCDRGTYLRHRSQVDLVPLGQNTPALQNPYGYLVVRHDGATRQMELAQKMADYLVSDAAQQRIGSYRIGGEPLFRPLHGDARAGSPSPPRERAGNLLGAGIADAGRLLWQRDPQVISAAVRTLWISCWAVAWASTLGVPLGIALARKRFWGRRLTILVFRVGMAMPTVFVGLVCFGLLSRRGPLGPLDWLYTPRAIICGEICLALPLVVSMCHGAVAALDARVGETARMLGASVWRRGWTYVSEARVGVTLAVLTAFSRCVTELGIAMMVGGNIKDRTRTLATATALETSKGEFARGIAMGVILLLVALGVTLLVVTLSREERDDR